MISSSNSRVIFWWLGVLVWIWVPCLLFRPWMDSNKVLCFKVRRISIIKFICSNSNNNSGGIVRGCIKEICLCRMYLVRIKLILKMHLSVWSKGSWWENCLRFGKGFWRIIILICRGVLGRDLSRRWIGVWIFAMIWCSILISVWGLILRGWGNWISGTRLILLANCFRFYSKRICFCYIIEDFSLFGFCRIPVWIIILKDSSLKNFNIRYIYYLYLIYMIIYRSNRGSYYPFSNLFLYKHFFLGSVGIVILINWRLCIKMWWILGSWTMSIWRISLVLDRRNKIEDRNSIMSILKKFSLIWKF